MAAQIEIHGYQQCPFAWRARLAALPPGNPYRVSRPAGPPSTWPQDLLPGQRTRDEAPAARAARGV